VAARSGQTRSGADCSLIHSRKSAQRLSHRARARHDIKQRVGGRSLRTTGPREATL
jgi:hypothetical protein